MSYARFSKDSDVYVFMCVTGSLECCGCRLGGRDRFSSTDAMVAHLREHIDAGHKVPDYALARLEENRVENDAIIRNGGA